MTREPAKRREEIASLDELYNVAYHCNAVRRSIQTLVDYTLKEGYEWVGKFSRRCNNCKKEYPVDTKPEHCEKCGAEDIFTATGEKIPWYEEPNQDETRRLDKFFDAIDRNGHSLDELLRIFGFHINVADDSFLIVHQNYKEIEKNTGEFLKWEVDEVTVADPRNFRMIIDDVTRTPGGQFWICVSDSCRPGYQRDPRTGQNIFRGQPYYQPGRCPKCDLQLYDVWYVSTQAGTSGMFAAYYLEREVIHASQYAPDYGHGLSQLVSVFNEAKTLMAMIEYIKTFYDEERLPRMMITFATANPDSIQPLFEEMENRNVSQGKHYVPQLAFTPGEGTTNPVQVHELSKLPAELQYLEIHDYCYRRIGAAFGVAPVFHGNVDAVGLQSQGPTQWAVTTLAAAMAQKIYNKKVFPKLLRLLGVRDWDLRLKEPEEKDDMVKKQVELMELQKALLMTQLGYEITGRQRNGDFEFSDRPTKQPMGGGFPGMPQDGPPPTDGLP